MRERNAGAPLFRIPQPVLLSGRLIVLPWPVPRSTPLCANLQQRALAGCANAARPPGEIVEIPAQLLESEAALDIFDRQIPVMSARRRVDDSMCTSLERR